jgi:hypothetical protein
VPEMQSLQQISCVARKNVVSLHIFRLLTGFIDAHAVVRRGMTLIVAERARAPIIGLSLYFAR